MSQQNIERITIPVSPLFVPHVEAAVARLSYLFPKWAISTSAPSVIHVDAPSTETAIASREIKYALYREKVYADTLPMRSRMYQRLFG